MQSTAGNTTVTLTGNIRKYWTLRKAGKQEPSTRQSTKENDHNTNGISFKLRNTWKPILLESKAKKTTANSTISLN